MHDAYARRTPYELSFPSLAWARDAFGAVREESEARGVDLSDPERFPLLGSVGRILQELRPEDDDPERVHPLGRLLFHAFHFWEAGEPVFLLEAPLVRHLLEASSSHKWSGRVPAPAGYVQLPQHLVWMEAENERPESVDGFFWSARGAGVEIHVLLAAGLLADRPGFSVVPLAPLSPERVREEADRSGTFDFASRMPGSELGGLYRVGTPGEVLEMVARVLPFLDRNAPGETREPEPRAGAPQPSGLRYRRVGLG